MKSSNQVFVLLLILFTTLDRSAIEATAILSKDTPSTGTKTYRMKTGDFIRCVGAEDDQKVSQKINFRGKGFNQFINHTTTLKCTMMEITNLSNTALTRTVEKRHAVLYCPKGMSYQANFLSIEKYRDTFTIGCDIPKQYFSL